ncbi:glycosyl transferase group 1 [Haladaptatus paucihalophilus DX253]|nr:glycosyl transferase group 1 [Haladaptatus paucihalophilus DX253]
MESDAIAVYGPHISDYLVDLGVEEDKISIAWNTVDTGQFSTFNQDRVADLRKEWGIPDDASVALFVGRLVKEKGVKYLLDAYKTARAVSEKPTYLLIVGDGDQRTELTEQVDDDHDVIFTGYINNESLPEYYALADVFVLPSVVTAEFREPWGLVINEAMSSGTAVITTGQVGASCIIDEGKNGFVVPERNEAALADRLAEIFENPTMASEMGVQAKKDSKLYDYERMLDGFDEAVQTAVVRSKNNG